MVVIASDNPILIPLQVWDRRDALIRDVKQ
jgi:hypothetical protein